MLRIVLPDKENQSLRFLEVDPHTLPDNPYKLIDILIKEKVSITYWFHLSMVYYREGKLT
jgi:hypothetical protein